MHIWTKIGTGERGSNASSFDFMFENLVPGFYGKEVLRESRGRRKWAYTILRNETKRNETKSGQMK